MSVQALSLSPAPERGRCVRTKRSGYERGPLMAQSRHAQCADECPLLGARRTLTNRCLPISIYEYTACSSRRAGRCSPGSVDQAALRLRRRIAARPRRPEPRSNRVAGSGTAASLIAIGLHGAAAALPPSDGAHRPDCCLRPALRLTHGSRRCLRATPPAQNNELTELRSCITVLGKRDGMNTMFTWLDRGER